MQGATHDRDKIVLVDNDHNALSASETHARVIIYILITCVLHAFVFFAVNAYNKCIVFSDQT